MLYACDKKFDVTKNLENFYELNKAINYRYMMGNSGTRYQYPNQFFIRIELLSKIVIDPVFQVRVV